MLAAALFDFGLPGLQLARVLVIFGLVALHMACVLFNFDESMVYVCLGCLTVRKGLVYVWLGCLTCSLGFFFFLIVARLLFTCGLAGLHLARALFNLNLIWVCSHYIWLGSCLFLAWFS